MIEDRQPLSSIMPQGDTRDDLVYKMRSLFINEYKGHRDSFMCTMCEMMDYNTLKKIYLYLEENK